MWTILAVLCLVTSALARKQFIVGGEDVDIADFPWQGSYRGAAGQHTCGCVFVGGSWVLTAAHCVFTTAASMEFGGSDIGNGTIFDVANITRNPDYNEGLGFTPNDIAVVEATTEISGPNISPATIATNADNPGGTGWITGWGQTCGTCDFIPLTLQGTEIGIIDDADCREFYGIDFQSSSMICVWNGEGGEEGACFGDSGGPLTMGSTLYGLTSWGPIACATFRPSVYNRVGAHYDWICDETSDEASGCLPF